MRILLLTPQRPYPPHKGTTLRNFNLVKQLATRHQVCVLTFLEPDQLAVDPAPLTELCEWVEPAPAPQRSNGLRLRQLPVGMHLRGTAGEKQAWRRTAVPAGSVP